MLTFVTDEVFTTAKCTKIMSVLPLDVDDEGMVHGYATLLLFACSQSIVRKSHSLKLLAI